MRLQQQDYSRDEKKQRGGGSKIDAARQTQYDWKSETKVAVLKYCQCGKETEAQKQ